jgi:hypothetical protein
MAPSSQRQQQQQQQQQQQHQTIYNSEDEVEENQPSFSSSSWNAVKYILSAVLLTNAITTAYYLFSPQGYGAPQQDGLTSVWADFPHRRLESLVKPDKGYVPSYMIPIREELVARKKLMEETPKEEIKYWFEYAGPLQVSECCRFLYQNPTCTCTQPFSICITRIFLIFICPYAFPPTYISVFNAFRNNNK